MGQRTGPSDGSLKENYTTCVSMLMDAVNILALALLPVTETLLGVQVMLSVVKHTNINVQPRLLTTLASDIQSRNSYKNLVYKSICTRN